MKKIFLSYAHADDEFAHPLAEKLKGMGYDVWIDKDKMMLGDDIFKEIAQGLANCDFGVVIISPTYMERKWPQRELTGLLEIEEATRKVILPIWKDVTSDQVKKFSGGMLSGRLSAKASDGVDTIASQIQSAVEAAGRSTEINAKPKASEKFAALAKDAKAKADSVRLHRSEEGAGRVRKAYDQILTEIANTLKSASTESLPFRVGRDGSGWSLTCQTRGRLGLRIHPVNVHPDGEEHRGLYINNTEHLVIHADILQGQPPSAFAAFDSEESGPMVLKGVALAADFVGDSIVWSLAANRAAQIDPVEAILDLFHAEIEKQQKV